MILLTEALYPLAVRWISYVLTDTPLHLADFRDAMKRLSASAVEADAGPAAGGPTPDLQNKASARGRFPPRRKRGV